MIDLFGSGLRKKTLGVIGLGSVGSTVAQMGLNLGLKVNYFSRTPQENSSFSYLDLDDLLRHSDIITTHLPRNNFILTEEKFGLFQPGTILINTSLGPTYDLQAFKNWINQEGNRAIVDLDGATGAVDFYRNHPQIIFNPQVAGMTPEAYAMLGRKVIRNIKDFLEKKEA